MADSEQLRIRGKLLKDLRVKDLKEELDNRGLPKTGSKNQLLSRLKSQLQLERLQSQPVKDQLPDLNEGADTDNEFVKKYLAQRQKLFEAQKEARRKLEEEENVGKPSGQGDGMLASESESHEEDSQTEPESPVKELSPPKPSKRSAAKTQKELEGTTRRSSRRTASQSSINEEVEELTRKGEALGDVQVPSDDIYDQKTPEPEDDKSLTEADTADEPVEQTPSNVEQPAAVLPEEPPAQETSKDVSNDDETLKDLTPIRKDSPSLKETDADTKSSPKDDEETLVPHKDSAPPADKLADTDQETIQKKRDSPEKEPSAKRSRRLRRPSKTRKADVSKEQASESMEMAEQAELSEKEAAQKNDKATEIEQKKDDKMETDQKKDEKIDTETTKSQNQEEGEKAEEKRPSTTESEPQQLLDIATTDQDEQLDYDEDIPQEVQEPKITKEAVEPVEAEPAARSPPRKEPTIKARKISLAKGRASKGERSSKDDSREEGRKKRKWGASSKTKKEKAFSISTDSLKEVMPALKTSIDSEPVNGTAGSPGEAQAASPDIVEVDPHSPKAPKKADDVAEVEAGVKATPNTAAVTKARTSIRLAQSQDEVVLSTDEEVSEGEVTMVKKVLKPAQKTITLPVEEPVRVRDKVSPPRNTLNATIHIQFLTRPFTIGQLKELLSKHGELCPDEGSFWIDKIKSHCYATFKEASSAEAARKELHGSRWPPSNPKVLRVEYGSMDEIAFRKDRYEAQLQGIPLESQKRKEESEAARLKARQEAIEARKLKREKEEAERLEARKAREERRKKLEKQSSPPAREWDKHKLRQSQSPSHAERRLSRRESGRDGSRERRRERSRSRRIDDKPARRGTAREVEEKPVVSLDDLFRKTVAEPAIYWLPLTEEKIALKEKKEQEREAERKAVLEKRAEEMKEQQARAEERRRAMAERMQRDRERRRRVRSRSPRQRPRQVSRSPVRRGRRTRSSSNSSSSRSRSRKRQSSSTPSPKRPARGSPSPRRPARGSPSPRRPARGSPSPRRPASGSPSPRRPVRGSPSPRRPVRGSPSPRRLTKSRSRSSSRASHRSRSASSKKMVGKESKGGRDSASSPPRKRSRSASSSSSSSGSASGSESSASAASNN